MTVATEYPYLGGIHDLNADQVALWVSEHGGKEHADVLTAAGAAEVWDFGGIVLDRDDGVFVVIDPEVVELAAKGL